MLIGDSGNGNKIDITIKIVGFVGCWNNFFHSLFEHEGLPAIYLESLDSHPII